LLHETIKSYVVAHPEATFYFPAGFGNHVDHLACKEIAFRLLDEGALTRVVLYEDVPYSWLRFIRTESYRALLQTVVLNEESREKAFRRDGEDFLRYIRSRMVPFPRGKTLFALVSASLILKNILSKSWRTLRKYSGEIRITELNDDQISKKAELLFHYESQIPMLFGEAPEELLHALHESFSREVTIEVTRLRSCA
jgi:hypothetical protein